MIIFSICHIYTDLMTWPQGLDTFQNKRKMIFQILYFMTQPRRPSILLRKRKIFINIVFTYYIYIPLMTWSQEPSIFQSRRKIIIFHILGFWVFKVRKIINIVIFTCHIYGAYMTQLWPDIVQKLLLTFFSHDIEKKLSLTLYLHIISIELL